MAEAFENLKLDIQAKVESAVFSTEVNLRDTLQHITTEYHIVPTASPYRIRLEEVPDKTSGLSVPDYTEASSLPSQQGTFWIDWVKGYVYFHSSDAGKVVNPQYFGKGALIDAEDINKITTELTYARNITQRLRPSAQNTADKTIKIDKGSFLIGQSEVTYLGNNNIRLGTGGEYEVSALTANYYSKILFTLTPAGLLKKYEGVAANTANSVVLPAIPVAEMPICIVTVQDDGTGTAGTIKNIASSDVKDIRPFLQVPKLEHRYVTFYLEGIPTASEVVLDGFYFGEAVTIDKVSIYARNVPKGSDLAFDLMKNGSALGYTIKLTQDKTYEATTIAAITFSASDKLSIKTTAVDSQTNAEGITVMVHYYINP